MRLHDALHDALFKHIENLRINILAEKRALLLKFFQCLFCFASFQEFIKVHDKFLGLFLVFLEFLQIFLRVFGVAWACFCSEGVGDNARILFCGDGYRGEFCVGKEAACLLA